MYMCEVNVDINVHTFMRLLFLMPLVPRHPENAFPESRDAAAGTVVPPAHAGIPQGTVAPFWVALRRSPFLFPTKSPWFVIPGSRHHRAGVDFRTGTLLIFCVCFFCLFFFIQDHLTVQGETDIEVHHNMLLMCCYYGFRTTQSHLK